MPSSLKLFWLSFAPLLSPLWITFTAQRLFQEIAFQPCPFTAQHRLDWTRSHLWPKAAFCQKANTVMGDADVKDATSISPTTSLPGLCSPGVVLPECRIEAQQTPSGGGSGEGQAEQSWSLAEFVGCPAAPDITQTLRDPPAAPGAVPPARWWESPSGTKGGNLLRGFISL